MRKLFFFCSIILAMSILNSCKKDNIATAETPKNLFNTTIKTDPTTDKAVKDKILNFQNKLKTYKASKDVETYMDIDDVEWYLEATLNFNYAEAGETFSDYSTPKFTFLAPIGTEGIEFQDIQDMYLEMVDSIENAYQELTGISKKVIAIDIRFDEITNGGHQVLVDCYPVMGFTTSDNVFSESTSDYWYWGNKMGKQNGDFAGQYDAADMLTLKSNQALNEAFDLSQYSFTDVEVVYIMFNQVPFNNQFGPYRLFHNYHLNQTPEPILSPEEMNFRLQQSIYISQMQQFKPIQSDGITPKGIISYQVRAEISQNLGPSTTEIHTLIVTYGVPHLH